MERNPLVSQQLVYGCTICDREMGDLSQLIEHLRMDHETLEIASFAAGTMASNQDRDRTARAFHRRFEMLRDELAGRPSEAPEV